MRLPRRGQIVAIDWVDIFSNSTWLDPADAEVFEPVHARSYGIVLSCDDKALRLAHNMLSDGQSDVTVYPMGIIQKVGVLK